MEYYEYKNDDLKGNPAVVVSQGFHDAICNKKSYLDWKPGFPMPPFEIYQDGKPTQTMEAFYGNFGKATTAQVFGTNSQKKLPTNTLDMSLWDTSNVKDAHTMFAGNFTLTELNLSMLNFEKVENINFMINACMNLQILDLSNQSFKSVKTAQKILQFCVGLEYLDISACENPIVLQSMFEFDLPLLKRVFVKDDKAANIIEQTVFLNSINRRISQTSDEKTKTSLKHYQKKIIENRLNEISDDVKQILWHSPCKIITVE